MKTPKFPDDFYLFSTSNKAIDVEDAVIKEWIDRVKSSLDEQYKRKPKRLCYSSVSSGNALVYGIRYKEEVSIYVSKNYYEFEDMIDE